MGLRLGDLKDNVDHIFEIDSFKSKMGTDADIVTLSFSVKEKHAADDLMNFIEKGYPFVLDADATAGEQSDGSYKVFVESTIELSLHLWNTNLPNLICISMLQPSRHLALQATVHLRPQAPALHANEPIRLKTHSHFHSSPVQHYQLTQISMKT